MAYTPPHLPRHRGEPLGGEGGVGRGCGPEGAMDVDDEGGQTYAGGFRKTWGR